ILPRAASAPRDPRARPRAWWAITVALACSTLILRSASAGAILTYSDITLSVLSDTDNFELLADTKVFPPAGPGLVSVLGEPRTWARFPTSQSALPGGYRSALITTTGFGGVGVSGFQLRGTSASAVAAVEQTITNTGDAETGLFLEFTIPR